jgi:hypothetical protein
MQDHDQRFKTLIREFFGDFLRLFFADWAARLDTDKVEWLEQDLFLDPPDGPRRVLDLVAKLPTRAGVPPLEPGEQTHWLALVHIEIESPDKATLLRGRMHQSYTLLRALHRLPVLPIAIYLKVGLDGLGIDAHVETFWELQTVHFQYLYVGLPALDAIQYMEGDNWLGVALSALMKITPDRVAWLGLEALRRLTEAPITSQQRFLLGECVQAYLPLDEAQQREFDRIAAGEPYRGVQAMNLTSYEKGELKGKAEGIEQGALMGRRAVLLELIEDRFGPLPPRLAERLEGLTLTELAGLRKAVALAKSLDELGLQDDESA